MHAGPSLQWRETPAPETRPHCIFVTGPRGSGKTRWLQLQIHEAAEREPGARCPAVLAEEGRTRMEGFAQRTPGVSVRRILLPCTCCAALADLPGAVRALVASERPNRIFVEVPAVAAAGLLAEFDRELGWQRELTVCLDRSWDMARREHALSPFQAELLERADRVVPNPAGSEPRPDLRAAAGPPLFP